MPVRHFINGVMQRIVEIGIDGAIDCGATPAEGSAVTERLALCSQCPENRDGRCSQCGCFLRQKVRLASSRCPLGKW